MAGSPEVNIDEMEDESDSDSDGYIEKSKGQSESDNENEEYIKKKFYNKLDAYSSTDCLNDENNEKIVVDFEGRAPIDPDFHGISQLLKYLFLDAPIKCNEVAQLIIAQNFVGSVIVQCADDGPESDSDDMSEEGTIFGITSVVNLTAKKEVPCVAQIRSFILEYAKQNATDAVLKNFQGVLNSKKGSVGFLINERFVNIPAPISVPLLENLHKEIEEAKAKKMKFNFKYFIMSLKIRRLKAKKDIPEFDEFINPEEELLAERAISAFDYEIKDNGESKVIQVRKIILLDAENLPSLIKDVQAYINGE